MVIIMIASNASALCWNPLELFCIFGESSLQGAEEIPKESPSDFKFKDNEQVNITFEFRAGNEKIPVTPESEFKTNESYGAVFDEKKIETEFSKSGKVYDKKIYQRFSSTENYTIIGDNIIRRPLGYKKNVTNELGQLVERDVFRTLDFNPIQFKHQNQYKTITKEFPSNECVSEIMVSPDEFECSEFQIIMRNLTIEEPQDIYLKTYYEVRDIIVES